MVNRSWLPCIRSSLELGKGNDGKAIETLQTAWPYELGASGATYAVHLRGEGFLALSQRREAAVEFQKIMDHRSIVLNKCIGALAHLGLARAYARQETLILISRS